MSQGDAVTNPNTNTNPMWQQLANMNDNYPTSLVQQQRMNSMLPSQGFGGMQGGGMFGGGMQGGQQNSGMGMNRGFGQYPSFGGSMMGNMGHGMQGGYGQGYGIGQMLGRSMGNMFSGGTQQGNQGPQQAPGASNPQQQQPAQNQPQFMQPQQNQTPMNQQLLNNPDKGSNYGSFI